VSQISYFIFVSEVRVTYSGWLALLFSAFYLVLYKLFITSPEAGVAGERGVDHLLGSRSCWRKIDDRLAVRGPGRWRPSSTERWCWCWWPSDMLRYFSCIFSFSFLSGGYLSVSCYFFTAETAENEFRRAGRAYIFD